MTSAPQGNAAAAPAQPAPLRRLPDALAPQLYRESSIGTALAAALDELVSGCC
jgi:hypothetical protein